MIAAEHCRAHDLSFITGQEKKNAYAAIAKLTYDFLHAKMPGSITNDMQKRMKDLELENASLRATNKPIMQALGARQSATTPQKPTQQIDINRGDRDKNPTVHQQEQNN